MSPDDLAWRVDEACLNARPSPVQLVLDGWLLRASGGPTRRTNSVYPTRHIGHDPSAIVPAVERIYASRAQPALFRVPTIAPAMEGPLRRLGYSAHAETCVLFGALSVDGPPMSEVTATASPGEDWLAAWRGMEGPATREAEIAYRRSIGSITLPAAFACRRVEGVPVSIAYGVLDRGLLVVDSVATHPGHRQQGHAFAVVSHLRAWAKRQGAFGACLGVLANNAPAHALYRSAGFDRELYRYHYRRNDRAGDR